MAAPSGIVWGSIVGGYGRIGIYRSVSSTATTTTLTEEVWFWSKYSVSDTSNTLYHDNLNTSGSATTSKGSVSISTTSNSGGWSTTNQVKIASYTQSYTRLTTTVTRYLYAKLEGVDRVGGTMYASTTFVVPQLDSYAVSYNANGGTGAPSNQVKWYGKSLTLSTVTPTRTGYTFKGWATSASGSVAYAAGASYTSNAALTLYAVWQANTYTVSYNANGGTGAPANQTKTHGVNLTLSSTKPTRTNYTFKGWGTSASATTVSYAAGASYTTNAAVTLYAIWELAYENPTITGYTVSRCTSGGVVDDFATYAKVVFAWSLCQLIGTNNISSIKIEWKTPSATTWTSQNVSASGTSGNVSVIVGANALNVDNAYTVRATVTDSKGGSTVVSTSLATANFPIDILAGGRGVAIGKAATVDGALDVYKQTIIRGNEDASGTAASGQLIIGDPDGYHIAMDNNEIMAKNNATTPGNISINYEGGDVGLGSDNGNVALRGNTYIAYGKALFGTNSDGGNRSVVQWNASKQAVFGYGGYSNNEGASYFDGNSVNIRSKGAIAITSPTAGLTARHYGVNKVLWSGGSYMGANQIATLSEAVSAQPHGIVLVWSDYNTSTSTVATQGYWSIFIPKQAIADYSGKFFAYSVTRWASPAYTILKGFYLTDTQITGHSISTSEATPLWSNSKVLVKVYGV